MIYDASNSNPTSITFIMPAISHTLTISSAIGGTTSPVAGTYTYNDNDQVTITATPSSGYNFDHWFVNGANVGAANPLVFNITSDTTVNPVFTSITPPICPPGSHWDATQNACIADTPDYRLPLIVAGAIGVGAVAYLSTRKKQKKPVK